MFDYFKRDGEREKEREIGGDSSRCYDGQTIETRTACRVYQTVNHS